MAPAGISERRNVKAVPGRLASGSDGSREFVILDGDYREVVR
jgi:hypothetical protein